MFIVRSIRVSKVPCEEKSSCFRSVVLCHNYHETVFTRRCQGWDKFAGRI